MKTKYKIAVTWLITISMLLSGTSCDRDHFEGADGGVIPDDDTEEIVFSLRTPSATYPSKSLDATQENIVNSLIILVFDTEGIYRYTAYPKASGTTGQGGAREYTVRLKRGTFDLIALANPTEYIGAFPEGLNPGVSMETVIRDLQVKLNGERWSTGESYKGFPMSATKTGVLVNKDTNLKGDNGFHLTRALAKLNLIVDPNMENKEDFELDRILVYNRMDKGQIIPDKSQWFEGAGHVTAPSLVSGSTILGPLIYDESFIKNYDDCSGEIYLCEVPAGNMDLHPDYPCIVVGGRYKGEMGYYRIDFLDKSGSTPVHIPLLRNYSYGITIASVTGEGFVDPGDAYESLPVNIEADVIGWDDNLIGDIYFNGQNYLRVDQGRYVLSYEERPGQTEDNTVYIETDWKGGWEFGMIRDEGYGTDWLRFAGGDKGEPEKYEERWIEVEENDTDEERIASIVIVAGRIKGVVTVTQLPMSDIELSIYDSGGNLINDGQTIPYYTDIWEGHSCEYTIKWLPADARVEAVLTNPATGYEEVLFSNSDNILETGPVIGSGEYGFGFDIKEFDKPKVKEAGDFSFPTQALEYKIILSYAGQTITKSFKITNTLRDVQATKLGGCMQGRFYNVDLKYNTAWVLGSIDDEYGILDMTTKERVPRSGQGDGETSFMVRLNVGREFDGKRAVLRFIKEGTELVYDSVEIFSYYNHPNSFIVPVGGNLEFSVVKAFRVWESEYINQPQTGDNLDVVLIWADLGVNINAAVDQKENLRESMISLNVAAEGNAVIGLTLDEKVIWSWHIWVTNYDPDGPGGMSDYTTGEGVRFRTMLRNMGARTTSLGNTYVMGVYYQWGRKDPFPTCKEYSKNPDPQIIGLGGNWNIEQGNGFYVHPVNAPATGALTASIRRPDEFLVPVAEPYDWYAGDGTAYNSKLWRSDDLIKTDFDPCPDGWRMPNYYTRKSDNTFHYTFTFVVEEGMHRQYGWSGTPVGEMPNAGYLDHTGRYTAIGSECWLWYGVWGKDDVTDDNYVRLGLVDKMWVESTLRRKRVVAPKAYGAPVRCEKDEPEYLPGWN